MKKVKLNIFLGYLVLVIVASLTSILGIYIGEKVRQAEEASKVIVQEEKPSQYPDWDSIKGKNPDQRVTKANITLECPQNGCASNKPATVDFDGIHKRYIVRGVFSRAYLYFEGSVDYNRPLTVWDDVYFSLNGIGGHLIPEDNTLPVPPSDITRYLYDLRSISYFPSIRDKEKKINRQNDVNLFILLQNWTTLDVTVSISSNRPGRVMKEVSIYYECFEGRTCSIEKVE